MRTKTITLYSFSELSEEAQQAAIDNWRSHGFDDVWGGEWRGSLNAFANALYITVKDWEVSPYGNSFVNFRYENSDWHYLNTDPAEEMTGLRLRTWLINNWLPKFAKGKYYSLKYPRTKYRHSRIQFEYDNCPLTGYCGDQSLIDPILKFIAKPDKRTSLADIIGDCLHDWAKAWEADMEFQLSDEYIRETIECNDYEFNADGSMA